MEEVALESGAAEGISVNIGELELTATEASGVVVEVEVEVIAVALNRDHNLSLAHDDGSVLVALDVVGLVIEEFKEDKIVVIDAHEARFVAERDAALGLASTDIERVAEVGGGEEVEGGSAVGDESGLDGLLHALDLLDSLGFSAGTSAVVAGGGRVAVMRLVLDLRVGNDEGEGSDGKSEDGGELH